MDAEPLIRKRSDLDRELRRVDRTLHYSQEVVGELGKVTRFWIEPGGLEVDVELGRAAVASLTPADDALFPGITGSQTYIHPKRRTRREKRPQPIRPDPL